MDLKRSNPRPVLSLFCLFAALAVVPPSRADDAGRNFVLFSNRAIRTAVNHGRGRSGMHLASRFRFSHTGNSNWSFDRDLSAELRLDTVDDIILSSSARDRLFADYRAFSYLRYVQDLIDIPDLHGFESRNAAQKLFFFESVRMFSRLLLDTPLGHGYRRLVERIRRIGRYASLEVSRGENGKVNLGRAEGEVGGARLLQLKLHASVRNGLEPRLRFGDFLTLRYDPIGNNALIELRCDF